MKRNHWFSGIIAAAAGVMMLAACSKTSREYTITGVVGEEIPGLVVVNLTSSDGQVVASDSIRPDGSFTFTGVADSLPGMALVFGDRAHRVRVFLEPGEIRVDLSKRTTEGTPLNDEFTAFCRDVNEIIENDTTNIDADSLSSAMAREVYLRHPDDALGALMFQEVAYSLTADELQQMLASAADPIKNNPYYEQLLQLKLAEKATAPGAHYLDVTGLDAAASTQTDKSVEPEGPQSALSTWAGNGRPTLVDFWASWCGPCRREIPNIAAVANQYAGRVNVVGIAVWDQLIDTQRAMNELGITWPVIFSAKATEAYGIAGIPQIMLIGADGTILARDLRGEQIARAIDTALAQE